MYDSIIVTGASSGLGMEYARKTASMCSGTMHLIARREKELLQLRDVLLSKVPSPVNVMIHTCDLGKEKERDDLLKCIKSNIAGRLLLVNNAGIDYSSDIWELTIGQIRQIIQVNVMAVTELTAALLPHCIQEKSGDIINVSTFHCDFPYPLVTLYSATKAFVTSFSESLRLRVEPYGIRVLTVCPGFVHTGFHAASCKPGQTPWVPKLGEWGVTTIDNVVCGSLKALSSNKARFYAPKQVYRLAVLHRHVPLFLSRIASQIKMEKHLGIRSSGRGLWWRIVKYLLRKIGLTR